MSPCNAGDPGSILWLGKSSGEGNGNPLQYSCLENSMDGGAWWATVHRVAKSWTRLNDFTSLHFTSAWWRLKKPLLLLLRINVTIAHKRPILPMWSMEAPGALRTFKGPQAIFIILLKHCLCIVLASALTVGNAASDPVWIKAMTPDCPLGHCVLYHHTLARQKCQFH